MNTKEPSGNVEPRIPEEPTWQPPQPPRVGEREWFLMIWDRYGFLIIVGGVLLVIGILYVNADALLQKPETWEPSPAVEAATQDDEPSVAAPASLTLSSEPAEATVAIDGELVGVTPLRNYALASGEHRLTLQKTGFASVDTVIQAAGVPIGLFIALKRLEDPEPAPVVATPPARPAPVVTPSPEPRADPVAERPPAAAEVAPDTAAEAASDPTAASEEEVTAVDTVAIPAPEVRDSVAAPRRGRPFAVGELAVTSEPSGAEVWLDGERVGVTPMRLVEVQVGPHGVLLRLGAYYDFATSVDVEDGEISRVHGDLTPTTGTLSITVRPWGDITIDGAVRRRQAESYIESLPAGEHRVRVEHPRYGKWERIVRITSGETHEVTVNFSQ